MSNNYLNPKSKDIEIFPFTNQRYSYNYKNMNTNEEIDIETYSTLTPEEKLSCELIKHVITEKRDGRVLSEDNLSLIFTKILTNNSYVIDADYTGNNRYVEFVINGRYVRLEEKKDNYHILSNDSIGTLYVYADFSNGSIKGYDRMEGSDSENGTYTGLKFTNVAPESMDSRYSLLLRDDQGNIPVNSKFRFTNNVIGLIDGGTV